MSFIQNFKPFSTLKPFFIPAIYHKLAVGKKKVYQLSIPFEGQELIIESSIKPFIYAGFNDVIRGAVLRMQRLFEARNLNLEVLIYVQPVYGRLQLNFELINKVTFEVAGEPYYLSIVANYNYDKKEEVSYYPILYRKVCSNGMLSFITKSFNETIPADKIYDINCEWSRCSFEDYLNEMTEYFEYLKHKKFKVNDRNENALFDEVGPRIDSEIMDNTLNDMKSVFGEEVASRREAANEILTRNYREYGYTEFAKLNIMTEFASTEENPLQRLDMIKKTGYSFTKQMEKTLKGDNKVTPYLMWNQLESIARGK